MLLIEPLLPQTHVAITVATHPGNSVDYSPTQEGLLGGLLGTNKQALSITACIFIPRSFFDTLTTEPMNTGVPSLPKFKHASKHSPEPPEPGVDTEHATQLTREACFEIQQQQLRAQPSHCAARQGLSMRGRNSVGAMRMIVGS